MIRRLRRSYGAPPRAMLAGAALATALLLLALLSALALAPGARAELGRRLVDSAGVPGTVRVRVERVVDGDTVVVTGERTVRVLGLDAPETNNPSMSGPQPLGDVATSRLAALVEGRDVSLEADVTDADHYGRLLRHVWLGRTLVSEVLLQEGLGHAMSVPPDVKHADRLRAAETAARSAGRGLWGLARPTSVSVGGTGSTAGHAGAASGATGAPAGTQAVLSSTADVVAATARPVPCGARIDGAIPAESAADFAGTFGAVEFRVVRAKDTGRVTFLNSHEPYQGHFYVAVFPSDYDRFPEHPALHYDGRCIVVEGTIEMYRGAPEIVIRGPEDVRIVSE